MPQNRPLLENWTPELSARMDKAIFVAQHRLHELDLFNDDRLVELLDRHPREFLVINTMGTDPTKPAEWQEGRAGNLDAEQLFESVQRGRVWLNLRRVMDHHSEYANLVNNLYSELEAECPGLLTYNRSANLLISSPGAIVYCHVDCPVNMLWHLRGKKRAWAYPLESGVVSDDSIEGVVSSTKPEEVNFRPEWDNLAAVYDLNPGEMVTWPQHTPHRVVNTEGVNVSLSTEHMTRAAARRNNVFLANNHFRKMFPGDFRSTELTGWRPAAKEFVLRIMRRIPPLAPTPPTGFKTPITFEVDLDAPDCIRQLEESDHREPVLQ